MSVLNTKTQFFRCNGLISVSKLKSKISEHILELAVINTRINDMEDEIIKGYHLSDIPKDTSKLSDESLIAFVEKRQKLFDIRDSINNKIDKLKSECTKIENAISQMPDCLYKTIISLSFIDGLTAKEISTRIGCSVQNVYRYTRALQKTIFGELTNNI